jgi:hypothetical protein
MMKFREFLKKRKAKTTTSKGVEQSVHQNLEPDNQVRANNTRVLLGIDDRDLPPAVIPPTVGKID